MNTWTRWACGLILATGISAFFGISYAPTLIGALICSLAGLCLAYDRFQRGVPMRK
jgi:presenilin-like A22 family membrane protease